MYIFNITCCRLRHLTPTSPLVLLALLLVASSAVPARAQTDPGFNLWINRDLTHLPSFGGTQNTSALYGGYIDVQNNRPFLELENTSANAMTEFRMTIGNEQFHFAPLPAGLIDVASKPTSLEITATAPSEGDELLLSFGGGGLQPGDFIHFQIRFADDSCPTCGLPSFQTVLFNMCHDGTSMGDKSMVSAEFAGGGSFGPSQWPHYPPSPFVEGRYAPVLSMMSMNPPTSFAFVPTQNQIPEPSGVLLAVVALAGMLLIGSSRRHRRQASMALAFVVARDRRG